MTSFNAVSRDTQTAIEELVKARYAVDAAYEIAVRRIITAELGTEWTARQYNACDWRVKYPQLSMPSIKELRKHGWVSYREEEFELPMEVRRNIETLTCSDGTVEFHKITAYSGPYEVGEKTGYGSTIVEIKRPSDFKGRHYVYRLN